MSGILNITPVAGLNPRKKFISELGEDCINMDGVIALMKQIDTPPAKAMYRAFRKRHAQMRQNPNGLSDEKIRENAVLAALADCGHGITFTRIPGTMDGSEPL